MFNFLQKLMEEVEVGRLKSQLFRPLGTENATDPILNALLLSWKWTPSHWSVIQFQALEEQSPVERHCGVETFLETKFVL